MPDFSPQHKKIFSTLTTPARVQDFLDTIPINFETDGETVKSPRRVLETMSAHCIEGALLGAYILSLHGFAPQLVLLKTYRDYDHVIAVFKINGYYGALSKTNHAALRYRDPVYKTLRELALSYFHEYFTDDGRKTLREYSDPLNLNEFEDDWPVMEEDLWGIDEALDLIPSHTIAPKRVLNRLRKADLFEREAGKAVQWRAPRKRNAKNK
jgi:hypothetical protein